MGYLGNSAETFCRDARWCCRLKIAAEIPDRPIPSEVRHNLYLAFKEAVNNAIRHSGGTELRVGATVQQDWLIVTVHANGKGFQIPDQKRRGGHGLGGTCIVRSGPQGGAVEFRLPLP